MDEDKFKIAIRNIYEAVGALRGAFPGRKFTPDGKMVGDIGEAIGKILYDLELDERSRKDWDGWWFDQNGNRREVQIRATQCDTTYLKKPPNKGTLLIFKIDKERMGEYHVIYNGDIEFVWNHVKHQRSKEKTISLKDLIMLQETVSREDMIPGRGASK